MLTVQPIADGVRLKRHLSTEYLPQDEYRIPFWIGSDRRIQLGGIRKLTTCREVIQTLIPSTETGEDPVNFIVIVETWRKMERKLDPNVRILKVWKAWGDQQKEVSFILRHHSHFPCSDSTLSHHTNTTMDGYVDKISSNKAQRRKSSATLKLANGKYHLPISKSSGKGLENGPNSSVERLLKLVLTQGETIQVQLKKLRYKEEEIQRYEEKMHHLRSLQEGENYVVDSYLRDTKRRYTRSERQRKATIGSETLNPNLDTIHRNLDNSLGQSSEVCPSGHEIQSDPNESHIEATIEESKSEERNLIEGISELNKKLTHEEEHLLKLGLKIQEIGLDQVLNSSSIHPSSSLNLMTTKSSNQQLLIELTALREITTQQYSEIERNEQSLTELETLLDFQHEELIKLTQEIQLLDLESEVLQERLHEALKTKEKTSNSYQPLNSENNFSLGPSSLEITSSDGLQKSFMSLNKISIPLDPLSQHSLAINSFVTPVEVSSRPWISSAFNYNKQPIILVTCPRGTEDNDSNSDTGISSLHSSGDEISSPHILDTLV